MADGQVVVTVQWWPLLCADGALAVLYRAVLDGRPGRWHLHRWDEHA